MDIVKAGLSLVGTAVIAGWVAYSVSAPRNANAYMNQEMDALGGQSINEHMAEKKAEVDAMQCAEYSRLSQELWDRAVANGTTEVDSARIDELQRQVDRYC
ncbi:hypothetical protein Q9K02_12320 [Qipengyuania sp. G39]|uniref:Uncharacterized protein n=1 Tax=Qipengyuania profundimaris TaxID=3067652 RepID=A0ABT9HTC1_9SPHN|nr:hypothetical protein [Qipengyuania sp. G39]MDP4575928.1 hypothetical protein [Qipengyuania sp. G39]